MISEIRQSPPPKYRALFRLVHFRGGTKVKNLRTLASTLFIATLLGIPVTTVAADEQGAEANVALATALKLAELPLERALAISSREGKAISAKYELEDDDADELQLSIYTMQDGAQGTFAEVIIDYATGKIAKVSPITEGEDLAAAKSQGKVMEQAKRSLEDAIAKAVRDLSGYRAVSAIPAFRDGHPVAKVTLVNGTQWKTVYETLE
jgi:hypothetical protein